MAKKEAEIGLLPWGPLSVKLFNINWLMGSPGVFEGKIRRLAQVPAQLT
jgi:hypothetical protein